MRASGTTTKRSVAAIVATASVLLPAGTAPAANRWFANASIAAAAQRYRDGARVGQCYVFVRRVLREATGGRIAPYAGQRGYNPGFRHAGGNTVAAAAAQPGDIIQVYPHGIPDDGRHNVVTSVVMPLHTAIVTRNRGDGRFDVVESNWARTEGVGRRSAWNPYEWAARRRSSGRTGYVRIWRLGSVGRARPPARDRAGRGGGGTPRPPDDRPSGNRTRRGTDFDGDGRDDVLWYGPGAAYDTLHYGTSTRGDFRIASVDVAGTYTPLAGDFDGDGRSDVLWYGPGSAHDALWFGGSTRGAFAQVTATVTGMYTPLVGDFDGDGRSDVLWYGPGSAYDTLHYGTATRGDFRIAPIDVSGTYDPVVGDFDGDGRDDVLWYGPGDAYDTLHYGTATGFARVSVEVRGTYDPIVGDFDGDRRDDILWYGPGATYDTLHYGTATRGDFRIAPIDVSGTYDPVVGDFDGDGRDDLYWYGPGDAHDALWFGTATPGGFAQVGASVTGSYAPVR